MNTPPSGKEPSKSTASGEGHDVAVRAECLEIGSSAEIEGHTGPLDCDDRVPVLRFSCRASFSGGPAPITPPPAFDRCDASGAESCPQGLAGRAGTFFDAGESEPEDRAFDGAWPPRLFADFDRALIAAPRSWSLELGIATLLCTWLVYTRAGFRRHVGGEKMLGAGVQVGAAIGRLALGLFILRLLRMVPFVGLLIAIVVVIWGLGALVLTSLRKVRPALQPPRGPR